MSEAGKIFKAIPLVMKAVGAIGKDQKNTAQNYKFRGIEDMYNGVQPALMAHGVFCCPQVIKSETHEMTTKAGGTAFRVLLTVNHKFYADDGSSVEVITVGEGIDSSDKASNKAMSAAMKYAFIELLSIPTADIADSDRETPEAGPRRSVGAMAAPGYVGPGQPDWNDGAPIDRGYFIDFGKWNRKSLEQVYREFGPNEIASYIRFLEDGSIKAGKPLGAPAVRFISEAEKFLGAMENGRAV